MTRTDFLTDCAAAGIDPGDRRYYQPDAYFHSGEIWCPHCRLHSTTRPRAQCDLQQAKAAEIRDAGGNPVYCFSCHSAFDGEGPGRCPDCLATYEAEVEKNRRVIRRSQFRHGVVYREDNCGDVERVHPTELAQERYERSGPEVETL